MNVLQNFLLAPHGKIEKGVNIYEQYIYICDVPLTFSGQLLVKKKFWNLTLVDLSYWRETEFPQLVLPQTVFFHNWDLPQLVIFAIFCAIENLSPPTAGTPTLSERNRESHLVRVIFKNTFYNQGVDPQAVG